jgi:hypothetical protein
MNSIISYYSKSRRTPPHTDPAKLRKEGVASIDTVVEALRNSSWDLHPYSAMLRPEREGHIGHGLMWFDNTMVRWLAADTEVLHAPLGTVTEEAYIKAKANVAKFKLLFSLELLGNETVAQAVLGSPPLKWTQLRLIQDRIRAKQDNDPLALARPSKPKLRNPDGSRATPLTDAAVRQQALTKSNNHHSAHEMSADQLAFFRHFNRLDLCLFRHIRMTYDTRWLGTASVAAQIRALPHLDGLRCPDDGESNRDKAPQVGKVATATDANSTLGLGPDSLRPDSSSS